MAIEKGQTKGQAKVGHNVKTQYNYCKCGGLVNVTLKFRKGNLTPEAECSTCHKTARKPRDLA